MDSAYPDCRPTQGSLCCAALDLASQFLGLGLVRSVSAMEPISVAERRRAELLATTKLTGVRVALEFIRNRRFTFGFGRKGEFPYFSCCVKSLQILRGLLDGWSSMAKSFTKQEKPMGSSLKRQIGLRLPVLRSESSSGLPETTLSSGLQMRPLATILLCRPRCSLP